MKKFMLESDVNEIVERIETKNKLEGKTILMTGARGFLGRYFIDVIKKINEEYFENPIKFIFLSSIMVDTKTSLSPIFALNT